MPNSTKGSPWPIPELPRQSLYKGQSIEASVSSYLHSQGLSLIQRNFRCRQGEIDLIAQQEDTLVFIEVRFRQQSAYGDPLASVTRSKQRKIIQSARFFLMKHPLYLDRSCRFDVIGVTIQEGHLLFDWIQHAFY